MYGYDASGNKRREHLELFDKTWDTQYAYDDIGRLAQVTYPDQEVASYSFSASTGKPVGMELSKAGKSETLVSGTVFDELNRPKEISVTGTLTRRYSYDRFTQLISSMQMGDSVTYRYDEYDAVKRLLHFSTRDPEGSGDRSYSYDSRGQLATAKLDLTTGTSRIHEDLAYAYAGSGDLLKQGDLDVVYSRDHGPLSIRSADGVKSWVFDSGGRLSSSPTVAEAGWGGENRLMCVKTPKGERIRYSYMPNGDRFEWNLMGPSPDWQARSTVPISLVSSEEDKREAELVNSLCQTSKLTL